jgi:NAD(P)-dependent dehydrogenase (short-subunit alcohol dehydrogenase family)
MSDSPAQRVALITGANTGIGYVTALELARQGFHVFMACRSPERAEAAVARMLIEAPESRIELLALDLSDLASVRSCANQFLARDISLSLLINNAGVSGSRGLTKSGFELAFGINHIGHFLLTQLLLPRLREAAPSRIITVASQAHRAARGIDWDAVRKRTRTRVAYTEYAVSKLANVLFNAELARRLEGTGVTAYALHPGVVASDIWRRIPWPVRPLIKLGMMSPEDGAAATLYCALATETASQTGLYYNGSRVSTPSRVARDAALAAELWKRSEDWVSNN